MVKVVTHTCTVCTMTLFVQCLHNYNLHMHVCGGLVIVKLLSLLMFTHTPLLDIRDVLKDLQMLSASLLELEGTEL